MPSRSSASSSGPRSIATALTLGAAALVLAACSGTTTITQAGGTHDVIPQHGAVQAGPNTPAPMSLLTGGDRQSGTVVASGGPKAPYNYAPTVLKVGGQYRMWWCSQLPGTPRPGDQILYAVASSPDGPFRGPNGAPGQQVFGNSAGGFDGLHTCDPSVIAVNGVYYLYYTGTSDKGGNNNAIGLATSTDGVHWARANGGKPVVTSANDVVRTNRYGVGQPSALYVGGWFYLMFTDTTGDATDPDGSGQFVLRSPDPAFGHGVQALGPKGFSAVTSTAGPRTRLVVDATTSDWMWSDALRAFVIASDGAEGTTVTFWNADFTYHPYQQVVIGGAEREGPGLVRSALGHAPVDAANPCGQVPVDVIRATGGHSAPTGLEHFGVDISGLHACQDRATALALLDGFAVPAPDRTVDIVTGDRLVEVERRSVALALAAGMVDDPPPAITALPVAGHLGAGAAAIVAPNRPVAMVLDDNRLWTVGSAAVAQLNSSPVATVTNQRYDAYPRGADLSDLR